MYTEAGVEWPDETQQSITCLAGQPVLETGMKYVSTRLCCGRIWPPHANFCGRCGRSLVEEIDVTTYSTGQWRRCPTIDDRGIMTFARGVGGVELREESIDRREVVYADEPLLLLLLRIGIFSSLGAIAGFALFEVLTTLFP